MKLKCVVIMAGLAVFASLAGGCSSSDETGEPKSSGDGEDAGGGQGEGPARLSVAFGTLCATCHGEEGRGKDTNPPIPGARDEQGYIARVRSGGGPMPKFSSADITDADLKADYAWLTTKRK